MKKFNYLALFIIAITLSFASCTKSDLYRPGGPESELNNDGVIVDDSADQTIIIPGDDDGNPPPKKKGKG